MSGDTNKTARNPVFRYEGGFVGNRETFDRIAALLGTNPTEDQRKMILAKLSPDSVRTTISELEATGRHPGRGRLGQGESLAR
jgi:hypothetical protein